MANCKKTRSKTSLQTTLRNNRTKEPKKLRGSNFYRTMGKDPIATKAFMRHKRLDTTQKYMHLLVGTYAEWIVEATNDKKRAQDLLVADFTYQLTTPDGYILFRKQK